MSDDPLVLISKWLERYRTEVQGMTQIEMAEKLEISRNMYQRLEQADHTVSVAVWISALIETGAWEKMAYIFDQDERAVVAEVLESIELHKKRKITGQM